MVTIKDGKLYGTVEIPVEEARIMDMLRYVDFSAYTYEEIADMAHSTLGGVKNMAATLRRAGYEVNCRRLPRGGNRGKA